MLTPVVAALPWVGLAAIAIPMIAKLFDKGPASRTATFTSGAASLVPDASRDSVFQGSSAFGAFGISKDYWLGPEEGKNFQPVIDAMTKLDDTIAKMVGGELTKSIIDALAQHSITVGMGTEGNDINASGGPGAIFKDRYATALDAIHEGMGQMVRDFEGGGDELAQFVLTLVSFEQQTTSATDALGEAQRKLIADFDALGLAVPDSAQGFLDLVNGLDLSTQAGRDTLNMLIALQPAFADVSNAVAGLMGSIQNTLDDLRGVSQGDRAKRGLGGAIDAFAASHEWAGPLREQLGDLGFAANLVNITAEDLANYAKSDAAGLAQINSILQVYSAVMQGTTQVTQDTTQATRTYVDAVESVAAAYDYTNDITKAQIQVLQLQGKDEEALRLSREMEMAALADAPQVLKDLTVQIWGLQDAAKEAAAASAIAQQRSSLEIQIMQLSGDAAGALAAQRKIELESLDISLRPLQQRIYALQNAAKADDSAAKAAADAEAAYQRQYAEMQKSIDKFRESADDLRAYSDSIAQSAQSLGDTYQAALTKLYSAPIESIKEVGKAFLDASKLSSKSAFEYRRDILRVASVAEAGAMLADAQAADLVTRQQQLQRVASPDTGLQNLRDANTAEYFKSLITQWSEPEAVSHFQQQYASFIGNRSLLQAHALGGTASGLSWVGERGPELVNFGQPSHVYTAQESRAISSAASAEVATLLEKLITETRAGNVAIAKNTSQTAKILQRFDGDGMPDVRVV